MIPEDVKYSREHVWVRIAAETATVGITDHAQQELGDLVFVDLPAVGDKVEAAQPMGTVESVKAVSELFSPLSGEVVERNETLLDHPERMNEDPHGEGWMVRISCPGGTEPAGLMTAAEYQVFLDSGAD